MKREVLRVVRGYEDVLDCCMYEILRTGMLLDEHADYIKQIWNPSLSVQICRRPVALSIVWSSGFLRLIAGFRSMFVPFGMAIPAGIHWIIRKLNESRMVRYKQNFKQLAQIICKQHELHRKIMEYYKTQTSKASEMKPVTRRYMVEVVIPKLNSFLFESAKQMMELMVKLNDAILELGTVVDIGTLKELHQVPYETFNFPVECPEGRAAIWELYSQVQMSFVLVVSCFLCGMGFSFCYKSWPVVNYRFTKIFTKIVPEALKIICKANEDMSQDFKAINQLLFEQPPHKTILPPTKLVSMNLTLNQFIENIQLIYTTAKGMQLELRKTDYFNPAYMLEIHYSEIQKFFTACQCHLKTLELHVSKQMQSEHVQAMQRHQETQCPTINEEQSSSVGCTDENIIRHDDADIPIISEEYSLTLDSTDANHTPVEEAISSREYNDLLECITTQKLIIRELNIELKKRKFITQDEGSSQDPDYQIPTAVVLPIIAVGDYSSSPSSSPEFNLPFMNEAGFVPPPPAGMPMDMFQGQPLPPFANGPYVPPPPPQPHFNIHQMNDDGELALQMLSFVDLAAQIQAGWVGGGNEEVFEDGDDQYDDGN